MSIRSVILGAVAASALFIVPAVAASCPENPDALGVSRTVEIDTSGGPGFGAPGGPRETARGRGTGSSIRPA